MKSQITLYDIAYARSGDKGADVNIGIIAYNLEGFNFLNNLLDKQKIKEYFSSIKIADVEKYPIENLWAINFILKGALGKGGSSSLRLDSQGKALGQALLEMPISIDPSILEKIRQKN
ncbi:MAG: hypothetical protein VX777_00515 [Chlamydiota bacterium]|nr:hypothetical protein [Chlamydiota bacterium]